ncbi:hypothetical protein PHYSODRAFT_329548 [Phytophthora sojae]|uniref:Retrotransposon Copia-like N-terminal domain-containing protein n=1 Tax=Phytophthora sojae (strain P6497) TaxID=1094619 RepID=G4Z4T1_PHYSP|nr:hypothetical protein PHYSODRAFT_329548 [Phytophthora sojae]EGZ21618.1 hypothetical protein PHYSODRAFT_329548 [Phytophthora sojae]|eukprot:XP_009524335.1 hypothetical protein PHYSODRAFT_329548 [Phytophthora sojae]
MARQVISPTIGRSGEDFPRLNGSNFPVWNARIRAALDGQGLLGFIDQEDYDGDSDSSIVDSDDDQDLKPPHPPSPTKSDDLLSDTGTLSPDGGLDADDAKRDDSTAQPKPGSSSGASSDSSSGNSSEAMATDPQSTLLVLDGHQVVVDVVRVAVGSRALIAVTQLLVDRVGRSTTLDEEHVGIIDC